MLVFAMLAACVRPELGIDDTVLRGTVRIEGTTGTEGDDATNATLAGAGALPDLGLGEARFSGTFAAQPNVRDPDFDWMITRSAFDHTRRFAVTAQAGVELAVYALAEDEQGELVPVLVAEGSGEGALVVEAALREGVRYAVRLKGTPGAFGGGWQVQASGPSPADLGVKVGAWQGPSFAERGLPVGGAAVVDFVLGEDGAWEGHYELLLLRALVEDEAGLLTVNEALETVSLYAGTFPSLNAAPAGTFYSSAPVAVNVTSPPEQVDALVLDAQLVLQAGFDLVEVEPNDVPVNGNFELDVEGLAGAQDVGALSGIGFVDVISGATTFGGGGADLSDPDVFRFTPPTALRLGLSLRWDEPDADLDLVVYDGAGEVLDAMATADRPEIGGGEFVYEPGVEYYLAILGYSGPDGDVPWTLRIEQGAP